MDYQEPFRKDRKGLYYLDSKDVKVEELVLKQFVRPYYEQAIFYKIEGISDYIIKDCTRYPYFFNRIRNLHLLKKLVEKQKIIDNIDFPIAYYKSLNMLKGFVIRYYHNASSLKEIASLYSLPQLNYYYSHENNEIDNFISLLLDILDLIRNMYDNGVYYTDIHMGNFLFYKNIVKVIDFEPGYVFFTDQNEYHLNIILKEYELLVNQLIRAFELKRILFHSGNEFYSTEQNIKLIRKRLER